jgi:tRNA(fMet)-specific endonuclease VapC
MVVKNPRAVILDTDVVSYTLKDDPWAVEYERLTARYSAHISFMTLSELTYWAERHNWGPRRRVQLKHLLLSYPTLPCDRGVAEACARLRNQREKCGRPIAFADAWIAATAIHFEVPLATHDRNFLDTPGLRLISANPEVCIERDRFTAEQRALDLSLRCGCSV